MARSQSCPAADLGGARGEAVVAGRGARVPPAAGGSARPGVARGRGADAGGAAPGGARRRRHPALGHRRGRRRRRAAAAAAHLAALQGDWGDCWGGERVKHSSTLIHFVLSVMDSKLKKE